MKQGQLCSSLQTRHCKRWVCVPAAGAAVAPMPRESHWKEPRERTKSCLSAASRQPLHLPTEVTVVPLDGEICSNLGSMKGVKEEEDLCFWSVLLAD